MKRLFPPSSRVGSRMVAALIAALLLIMAFGSVLAQGGTSHKIRVGDTASGTLDSTNFVQVYTFDARAGDVVSAVVTAKSGGLTFAVFLTDALGTTIAKASDLSRTSVSLREVKVTADGAYYLTVMRATGAQGTSKGDFTLTLSGTRAPASTGTVALAQGMNVTLSWSTADDMNLEVRDPVGGAVNFRNPAIASGGSLTTNANGECNNVTSDNPNEVVSWPQGSIPGGSYEIIVYFSSVCTPTGTSAVTSGPIDFAVTITTDGETSEPIRGRLSANQQYIASFILTGPTEMQVLPGGPLSIDTTPFASKIAAPSALNNRTSVNGTIDRNNTGDAWSFEVTNGPKTMTIGMSASTGSLDPFLALIDANGASISTNDDSNPDTRNAEITQQLQNGRYTVLATRFGLQIGGTEGNYTLTVGTGTTNTGTTGGTTTQATATVTPTAAVSNVLPSGSIQVTLVWNTDADMRLLIRDPNGVSVFSDNQQPENSGILDRMGNFKCETTTTSPTTYAYWPTQQVPQGTYEVGVWLQARCANTTSLPQYTLTVSVGGREVLKHQDRADPNGLHFLTTFTIDASGGVTPGQGGIVTKEFTPTTSIQTELQTAIPVTPGQVMSGTISAAVPYVIYSFTATQGQTATIGLKQSLGNLDPLLYLLSPNGVRINVNDDNTDINSLITQTITADGTYYVVATRYGVQLGGTMGNFELTVNVQ